MESRNHVPGQVLKNCLFCYILDDDFRFDSSSIIIRIIGWSRSTNTRLLVQKEPRLSWKPVFVNWRSNPASPRHPPPSSTSSSHASSCVIDSSDAGGVTSSAQNSWLPTLTTGPAMHLLCHFNYRSLSAGARCKLCAFCPLFCLFPCSPHTTSAPLPLLL